ncbi:MAG: response regulator [Deltaproteobacteria bacterium]|nr:response regulator [Deltaproteobacteria bacterium]
MIAQQSQEQRARLLIIDDEPMVGRMLCRLLGRSYETTFACGGNDGLQAAMAQQWDAILCDVMMSDLSGPDILRRLEWERSVNAAKVGFMTGGAFGSAVRPFLARCEKGTWLAKPFTLVEVRAFVDMLCAREPSKWDEPEGT